ncbi:hypothetical protein CABS03_08915 [Colletotrichum abscissum]|uniref:Uncharacterized protein n=1 Tax=Colletotrichum abscissum TaxID=1671311 RepID=A0A9Q0AUQ7_9PEZI|nr:hypothetical protein CABS02_13160 [Colletotrichum abscissum]
MTCSCLGSIRQRTKSQSQDKMGSGCQPPPSCALPKVVALGAVGCSVPVLLISVDQSVAVLCHTLRYLHPAVNAPPWTATSAPTRTDVGAHCPMLQ